MSDVTAIRSEWTGSVLWEGKYGDDRLRITSTPKDSIVIESDHGPDSLGGRAWKRVEHEGLESARLMIHALSMALYEVSIRERFSRNGPDVVEVTT